MRVHVCVLYVVCVYVRREKLIRMVRVGRGRQARSQGGANGCNCTPPLDARSAWQAMNIIHLIVYCSAIYMYMYTY